MEVLHGHTTPETGYVVYSYPFSWDLRCQIRYWIESKYRGKGKGKQRFCSQTTTRTFNYMYTDELNKLRLKYMDNGDDKFDVKKVDSKYVSELTIPSHHQWNKVKCGVFFDMVVMVKGNVPGNATEVDDDTVTYQCLSMYSNAETIQKFGELLGPQLDDEEKRRYQKLASCVIR